MESRAKSPSSALVFGCTAVWQRYSITALGCLWPPPSIIIKYLIKMWTWGSRNESFLHYNCRRLQYQMHPWAHPLRNRQLWKSYQGTTCTKHRLSGPWLPQRLYLPTYLGILHRHCLIHRFKIGTGRKIEASCRCRWLEKLAPNHNIRDSANCRRQRERSPAAKTKRGRGEGFGKIRSSSPRW